MNAPTVWILTDGKAGDEGPLIGIAEAMGAAFELRRVRPGAPFAWAMPFGPIPPGDRPGRAGSPIAPPFPAVCLASGRRAVAYLRALKAASPDTLTVFYRDPRTRHHGADLIVAQSHDGLGGERVLSVVTGPHRFRAERIEALRRAPPPEFATLPVPRAAVLVGGDSRHHRFTHQDQNRLMSGLEDLAATGASLMITPSRRTPAGLAARLRKLGGRPGIVVWDGVADNPIEAILALADTVVVTADSTNMIGEAAATGRPLQVFHPSGGHPKTGRFLAALGKLATVADFPAPLDLPGYPPVDSTPAIAARVLELWRARAGVSRSAPPDRS